MAVSGTKLFVGGDFWNAGAKPSTHIAKWDADTPPGDLLPPPAAPILSSPANSSTGIPVTPTLGWNAVSGAASYRLQVSTVSNFATTTVDQTGLTSVSYAIPSSTLSTATTYHWRVNATGDAGTSLWSSVWSFTTVAGPTTAPVLVSPVDQGITSLTPEMQWESVAGATSYQVQVSASESFTTPIVNQSRSGTSYQISEGVLFYATPYHWRVRGSNVVGNGPWSVVRRFQTLTPVPATPELTSPSSGETGVSLTPTLMWSAAEHASEYEVNISPQSDFSTVMHNVLTPTAFYPVPSGVLGDDKTYYWRVRGWNIYTGGRWSSAWSFRTTALAPAVPVLVGPSNGGGDIVLTPTLLWRRAERATQYQVQVSTVSGFSTLVVDVSGMTDTSHVVSAGLLTNDRTFYWRVRASNSAGPSGWSGAWSFRTIVAPPATPTLHTPSAGAANFSRTPTFIWRSVSGATSYQLQISRTADFSTTVISSTGADTVFAVGSALDANTRYYWRVRASNAGGTSDWSTRDFTTSNLISEVSRLNHSLPTNFALEQNYPNPFNPTTAIRFSLAERSMATLEVYSYVGQRVAVLLNDELSAGVYESRWMALELSSGMYFYRLMAQPLESGASPYLQTRKMILMK